MSVPLPRRRGGRPATVPPELKRTKVIGARLTEDEYADLLAHLASQGETPSEWLRAQVDRALRGHAAGRSQDAGDDLAATAA